MAQQPKKDISSLPRGAISIKGLPLSRNTRLPSIRSPRDLTLGAAPKRTFMPNIPVRREKKPQVQENVPHIKQKNVNNDKVFSQFSDKGRERGRSKPQLIQTQGSIFSEGIAADPSVKKTRETYQKSEYASSSKAVFIKKEKEESDVAEVSKKMDKLFRDDFIDDGDDYECDALLKPTVYPLTEVKKEVKTETKESIPNFNPDIAKEMNFDVNRVAQFIKKEKGIEVEEYQQQMVSKEMPSDDIRSFLKNDGNCSKLALIQLPEFLNLDQKMDDSEPPRKKSPCADLKISDNKNISLASIKALPEGCIGKLQILKSGKVRLLIGTVEFILDSLQKLHSKHEIVSINTNSNTGDLTVLGYVQHKLKFAPGVDCLLI